MNKLGITKIEVLIVALIIGLMGVASTVAVSTARSKTRDAIRLSDVRQLQAGLELFFVDYNIYPEALEVRALGTASTQCLSENGFSPTCSQSIESVYLEAIAGTPKNGLKELSSCGDQVNAYCYIAVNGEYRIQFELENSNPLLELQKGINCATENGLESGNCSEFVTQTSQE